jgi:hypothetical protein
VVPQSLKGLASSKIATRLVLKGSKRKRKIN